MEYAVIHTASPYLTLCRVGLRQEGTLGEVWENMGEGQGWDGADRHCLEENHGNPGVFMFTNGPQPFLI